MKRAAIGIPALVIGLLVLPMVMTQRSFGTDWTLHLWLVRQQQWNIQATGRPGLFLSAQPLGAFYPIFPFVGSGIYSLGGYLAIALGDRPIVAYKLLSIAGLCAAYGGLTWLSILRGLRGWRAQMSGLVFVTGFYMVRDLASLGDFGELMGLSSIPLLMAATYAMLTSPQRRLRHFIAVVGAVFMFTGSQNITLLWGSTFIGAAALLAFLAYHPRLSVPWKRVGALAGAAAIGAGLNAWYLFPDVAYSLDTAIARINHEKIPTIITRFAFPFDPRPGEIRVTIPWMFVAWAVVVAVACWRGTPAVSKRLFLGTLALGSGYLLFVLAKDPWKLLPHPFYNIQFAWRLDAYVLLATALLVMLVLERQALSSIGVRRASLAALALIAVFAVGRATDVVWTARSTIIVYPNYIEAPKRLNSIVVHSRTVIPPSWYSIGDFRDVSSPTVPTASGRTFTVPLSQIHSSSFSGVLDVPDGLAPFTTNIAAGPRLLRMTGIRAVGRTNDGFVVATRAPGTATSGPIEVRIGEAHSAILLLGEIASLASALALAALIALRLVKGVRSHDGHRSR